MNFFDTPKGYNTMENISIQLTRIADSLEVLAAAWGKAPESKAAAEEAYRRIAEEMAF